LSGPARETAQTSQALVSFAPAGDNAFAVVIVANGEGGNGLLSEI